MKKLSSLFIIIAIAICAFFSTGIFTATPNLVRAGSVYGNAFYNNNVLADLDGATMIDGTAFSPWNYMPDTAGELRVLNIVEYGYSYHDYLNFDYGIVLYLYNPRLLDIAYSADNSLQMAWGYSGSTPMDYRKVNVEILNRSGYPFDNLFIKVRVSFTDAELGELMGRLDTNKNTRKYDISSIELDIGGELVDYKISYSITATGFAEGLGEDLTADSTLSLEFVSLETTELELQHTYFDNYAGDNVSKRLSSVYFAVDNQFFDWYGALQRIKAQWYEYKLKDILVTKSSVIYDRILPYLRQMITSYNEDIGRTLATDANVGGLFGNYSFGKVYNSYFTEWYEELIPALYLMYKVSDIKEQGGVYEGGVTGAELWEDIQDYVNTYSGGNFDTTDLFTSGIDSYRYRNDNFGTVKRGYSFYDFDYGEPIGDMLGHTYTNSFWEDLWDRGFWGSLMHAINGHQGNYNTETYKNIRPIKILTADDFLSVDNNIISKNLYVRAEDVPALRQYYLDCIKNKRQAVLFRFAINDYYSEMASILNLDQFLPGQLNNEAYFASETVFLNFDIIQLTFSKDGQFTVIPVVSNPIDIVNDILPPVVMPEPFDWWRFIKACLITAGGVVVFLMLWPYLPGIGKFLLKVITFPFKIFKGGGG